MDKLAIMERQQGDLRRMLITMPKTLGDLSVQFFKSRFREQGWRDSSFVKWKPRSPKAKRNSGRAILIDTGRLRRSIHLAKVTYTEALIASDAPYARFHNEGFQGNLQIKAHWRNRYKRTKVGTGIYSVKTRKQRRKTVTTVESQHKVINYTRRVNMPSRRFMGESAHLNNICVRKVQTEVIKIFQ